MSYCLDNDFASSIGLGSPGDVYWAIKIESAALVGRNNITDVQVFFAYEGTYDMNIYSGADPTGTAIATQTINAAAADTMSWKTIHFTNPIAITQSQDLWVVLHCSTLAYPATGVVGTEYDNGKYISLDGVEWQLVTTYGLNYTWMIKVISDTYTPAAPAVTLNGPVYVINGDTATFTMTSPNATSYSWNITADYTNSNGATAQAMWLTDGTHQVIGSATNAVGTTTDTLNVEVITCNPITTFPFFEDFENGLNPCWTMVSNDPANDDLFGVFEDTGYAYDGDYDFWFSSYYTASDYNQYLITPELQLPTTESYMVKFYYQGYSSNDVFKVLASTTTNDIASFTELADFTSVPTTDWGEASLLLPAGTKYVAINYYANYKYYLFIDNFSIESLSAPEVTLDGPTAVPVGTAATYTATSQLADSFAWFVDGVAETTTTDVLNCTFTTAGNHTVQVIASNTVGSDTASLTVEAYTCEVVTTFPYTDGFENGLRCYTMISNDPANDDRFGIYEDSYAYEGNYDFRFSSYHSASDYNQYLITPELQLPATGTYMMKFYYSGYTTDEPFKVLASTTTNAISSFTELADYTDIPTDWTEGAVLLPAGTKYVAINYYGEYRFYLYIDNISIELLGAPTVTISGPTNIASGASATFTANAPLATSFAWTVDGTAVSSTTNTMTTTFTTGGNHTVAVTASNSEGSSTATMTVNVFSCDAITTFPFVEDFESADGYDCWTFIDYDGDGFNWTTDYLRDVTGDDGSYFGHNNSTGMVASASWNSAAQAALNPDNWMITPAMAIPSGNPYILNWFAKGQDASYAAEYYSVYVSTSNSIDAFLATTPLYSGYSDAEWGSYNVNLGQYAGQTIYIAFRHYNVSDMFYLDIDDISVVEGVGIVNHDMSISVYPNPATNSVNVMGEGIQQVQILDMDGRTIMTFNEGGQLGIGSLANGIYLVRIVTDNGVQMNKIIKK